MKSSNTEIRGSRSRIRAGTTMVESTIVLAICLFLLFGMLEMSIVVARNTLMSEAARRLARAAIVHGNSASPAQGEWGPAPLNTHAASGTPQALAVRDLLMTIDPNDVSIDLAWLDGDNRPDQRVQVTVRYTHRPIVSIPGLNSQLELQGRSTMRIAH